MPDFEERRARLRKRADEGGVVEKAQFELFEYETSPRNMQAMTTHARLLYDTVKALLDRRHSFYSEGYADGYADAQKGNPPYVEPTTPEERPDYEYGFTGSVDPNAPGGFVHDVGTDRKSIETLWFRRGELDQGKIVRRTAAGRWEDAS